LKKIDFKKELKELYGPSIKEVSEVNVPVTNYLMIDGKGDPNTSQEFKDAIETLYPVAYAIKFFFKKQKEIDYGVLPLEGLWWAEDMNDFVFSKKDNWFWTLMIAQPSFVTREIFEENLEAVKLKKKLPIISRLRFETYDEGRSAQIMHIGSYTDEGANIQKIHEFIKAKGGKLVGKHHEIYLSDARKADPAKMKTVLRQPFK
jgi:hypothetical protein